MPYVKPCRYLIPRRGPAYGIRYLLSQKHYTCASRLPDCCCDGWRVTLARSRFISPAEQRYASIRWSTGCGVGYFTQECNDLLVITYHKPLVKVIGDQTLDEIPNSQLFRLKQRTLPCVFEIVHLPGKTSTAADDTSRHPVNEYAEIASLALCSPMDDMEHIMNTALSWEDITLRLHPTLSCANWCMR